MLFMFKLTLPEGKEMIEAKIYILTDNNTGKNIASRISQLGFDPEILTNPDQLKNLQGSEDRLNILIIDMAGASAAGLNRILNENNIKNFIRMIVLDSCAGCEEFYSSGDFFNVELFTRPVDIRAFLLLFEKMVFGERYRQLLRIITGEAESRIQTAGDLLAASDSGPDSRARERDFFIKILEFEKKIIDEHIKLNDSIRHMSLMRNTEYMALKDRIRAEEMLGELRRQELLDAKDVINAQESLLDFSSKELHETKRILAAREHVEELGRTEAMELHAELKKLREINSSLEKRIEVLHKDNENLRKRV